jgi:hypothetical protein
MIEDVSETLRGILQQRWLPRELLDSQIVFDQPADGFKPTRTTIDLFLYELRENHHTRVDEKTLPLACTYLVTAWPVDGQELALKEHRLLSEVLQVFMGYSTIPTQLLKGRLVSQDPLPQLLVMRRDSTTNFSEFWSSLGSKPKPSLTVTVTIGVSALASGAYSG